MERGVQRAVWCANDFCLGNTKLQAGRMREREASTKVDVAQDEAGRRLTDGCRLNRMRGLSCPRLPANVVGGACSEVLDIEPVYRHFRRAPEAGWAAQTHSHPIGPRKSLRFEGRRAGNADVVRDNLEAVAEGYRTHGHAVSSRLLETTPNEGWCLPLPT
jgi:hypothetical protein